MGKEFITMKVATSFNDDKILKAAEAANRSALNHMGAFVRKTAQRGIRTKKTPSRPGHPPHTKTRFLRKQIIYAYDWVSKSVIIGPWLVPWFNMLHEHGGRDIRGVEYPARPYMGPALERAVPAFRNQYPEKFSSAWNISMA